MIVFVCVYVCVQVCVLMCFDRNRETETKNKNSLIPVGEPFMFT
jgi:hypothetical protein